MANYLTPSTPSDDYDGRGSQPGDERRDEVGDESARPPRLLAVVLHDCPVCARRRLDADCCFPVTFRLAEGGF